MNICATRTELHGRRGARASSESGRVLGGDGAGAGRGPSSRPARALFFWATHQGAELDFFATVGGRRLGFEFKRTTVPRATKSMHIALEDLKLDRLDVIYEGKETYALEAKIRAVPLIRVFEDVRPGARRA